MRCLLVFFGLLLTSVASSGFDSFVIVQGIGKQGWCDGMDMAPNSSLGTPTTAAECYDKCKQTYNTTIAVDFWDINDENRNANNICWCQDQCACLKPSLPNGGNGTLYIANSSSKGSSCGYDLHAIKEYNTPNGWCLGSDIKLNTTAHNVNNQHACYAKCKEQYNSTAIDWWNNDNRTEKQCFCQSECPCKMASLENGGDGMLAIEETVNITGDLCYKMEAGIGKKGWCVGFDKAPNFTTAPRTAKECFDNCKSTHPGTVAVDFWNIKNPNRNDNNICWCQDACDCVSASKSDAGNGVLFVSSGTAKGPSCGFDMKTVMEGNANSVCDGEATPATSNATNVYACQKQCLADGFKVSTHYSADNLCHCQNGCSCTKAPAENMGSGYLTVLENMSTPALCDFSMNCGSVKSAYRDNNCCDNEAGSLIFR